ncbi:hypothetical protein HPB52_024513 [Rhipicephalus sanguineus]|uniref:Uncharacterized protein n=1 Tax=Rhipicephalus sanguineus TaxID=34632 RepID=A0A9D4PBR1_RHISA|nr:hypothetical protein HPB52_024513 [Rhipicephalus sanguineus]
MYAPWHPLIDSICEIPALESLSITGFFLGSRTVERVGAIIAKVKSLRSVKFARNEVHPGPLRDLSLSDEEFDEYQMSSILEGLRTNHSLHELHFEGLDVAQVYMVGLALVLRSHAALKYLTVTRCHLAEAEANFLAVLLECNTRLLGLNLSCNEINDIGAIRIARSLKLERGLPQNADLVTSLHLGTSVHVNAYCLKTLFVSLAAIPCLNSLLLECETNINAPLNESVFYMDVEFGALSGASTRAIMDMLKRNATLIHFGHIMVQPFELQLLGYEMRSNCVLQMPVVEELTFEICDVHRRNLSYCNRAVKYAMNPEKFGTQRVPAAVSAFYD